MKLAFVWGIFFAGLCLILPGQLLGIFTRDPEIIGQGQAYMDILLFTFPLFMISATLMAALRVVGTVRISFYISVLSLIVNASVNYTLIFGHFGFPEMGVRGAAIGTLISRFLEFVIVYGYVRFKDRQLDLFSEDFLGLGNRDRNSAQSKADRELGRDYMKVAVPVMLTGILWAVSVPLQTAILGHLPGPDASDAIAANSVAMTFYQYLKVVVAAMARTDSVRSGSGDRHLSGSGPVPAADAFAQSVQPDRFSPALCGPDHGDPVLCDDRDVVSDAGQQRGPARERRYAVYDVAESDQCLGYRHAAFLPRCFCLEAAGSSRGALHPV